MVVGGMLGRTGDYRCSVAWWGDRGSGERWHSVDRHMRWHSGGQLTLVTGAKFEGDQETWDPASCRRARLAGADGSARELTAWTAVWGRASAIPGRLSQRSGGSRSSGPLTSG
jgi:hypothetical protein